MKIRKTTRRDVWTGSNGLHGKKSLSLYRYCVHIGPKHPLSFRVNREGDKQGAKYDWFFTVNREQALY